MDPPQFVISLSSNNHVNITQTNIQTYKHTNKQTNKTQPPHSPKNVGSKNVQVSNISCWVSDFLLGVKKRLAGYAIVAWERQFLKEN